MVYVIGQVTITFFLVSFSILKLGLLPACGLGIVYLFLAILGSSIFGMESEEEETEDGAVEAKPDKSNAIANQDRTQVRSR